MRTKEIASKPASSAPYIEIDYLGCDMMFRYQLVCRERVERNEPDANAMEARQQTGPCDGDADLVTLVLMI